MGDNPRRESTDTARQDMNIITNPSDYGRRSADDKSRVVS
jgi:hypothetical protein